MLTLGDWCVPGHELRAVARPSDFMLTHLALFGAEDKDNAATWAACFDATLQVLRNLRLLNIRGATRCVQSTAATSMLLPVWMGRAP